MDKVEGDQLIASIDQRVAEDIKSLLELDSDQTSVKVTSIYLNGAISIISVIKEKHNMEDAAWTIAELNNTLDVIDKLLPQKNHTIQRVNPPTL